MNEKAPYKSYREEVYISIGLLPYKFKRDFQSTILRIDNKNEGLHDYKVEKVVIISCFLCYILLTLITLYTFISWRERRMLLGEKMR